MAKQIISKGSGKGLFSSLLGDVFGKPNFSQLVSALSEKNGEIVSMEEHDENLENYFISIVGGAENE